jgi:hypothetical protein
MSYPTMPNPALKPDNNKKQQPKHVATTVRAQAAIPQKQALRRSSKSHKRKVPRWLVIVPLVFIGLIMMVMVMSAMGLWLAFANKILPQVTVAGIDVGGMTVDEAETVLSRNQSIQLVDGNRTWNVNLNTIGLTMDVQRTALAAFAQGHGTGGLSGLFARVAVAPIVDVDTNALRGELERMASNFNIAPVNAGVQFVNGQVQPTAPQLGRSLNIDATVSTLVSNAGNILADGRLELVMQQVQPAVMDAAPIVREAELLLNNPLEIRVFDPVT